MAATATAEVRSVRPNAEMARQVGARIKERREATNVTQEKLANVLEISRSAIAQWESGTTSPSLTSLQDMSRILDTTPEYLAFGIADGVKVVYRAPEREDLHTIDVVKFGDTADAVATKSSFALDAEYAQQISLTGSPDTLRAIDVPANNLVPNFQRGDRAIFDVSAQRVTGAGIYVYWNGVSASIAEMNVALGEDGKPMVMLTEGGRTISLSANKMTVIGKIVAHWGRV